MYDCRDARDHNFNNSVSNGVAHSISTCGFQLKDKSEGAQMLKKSTGNAGKGAAIDAASGVGVSTIKKGEMIRLRRETVLELP